MTPEQHAQLERIFEAAVELEPGSRAAYLDQACSGDAELRAHVEKLLESNDATVSLGGFLDVVPEKTLVVGVLECPSCLRCYDTTVSICPHDGSPLAGALSGPPLIGEKYLIERRLGKGGMGAVYLVKHIGLDDRLFALKLILMDGNIPRSYVESFETEAKALGRLKHPNIVDVTDYGVDPRGTGLPYLVMEYLDGYSLRQFIDQRKRLAFDEILTVLRETAKAIDAAHELGIVHGDLKPLNLFLAKGKASSALEVKVVDFGLARIAATDPQEPVDGVRGTPSYMAPELFRQQPASAASDRFAVGVLAYELLTGVVPFGRQLLEIFAKQQQPAPAPSSVKKDLPVEIDAPVLAFLDADPAKRPLTAASGVEAIASAWLAAERRMWKAKEYPKRIPMAIGLAAVIFAVAFLAANLKLMRIIEDRSADMRMALLPRRAPDPRLTILAIDEATLAEDRRPLASRAADFGIMIDRLFAAGARGVAVDVIMPDDWSGSPEFRKAVAAHADKLTLAVSSGPTGLVTGSGCVDPLTASALGPAADAMFGFVNLEDSEDGILRRARLNYKARDGAERASFGSRAAASVSGTPGRGSDAFRMDTSAKTSDIPIVSWKDAVSRMTANPDLFRGKLVLMGATFEDSNDVQRIPAGNGEVTIPGVLAQGLIVDTILAGLPVRDPGLMMSFLAMSVLGLAVIVGSILFPHRLSLFLLLAGTSFSAYAGVAIWMMRSSHVLLPVAAPELALALSAIAAWASAVFLSKYPAEVPVKVLEA